eukprot:1811490-Prymnesium_polylepis.1
MGLGRILGGSCASESAEDRRAARLYEWSSSRLRGCGLRAGPAVDCLSFVETIIQGAPKRA